MKILVNNPNAIPCPPRCKICGKELQGLRTVFCSKECSRENDLRYLRLHHPKMIDERRKMRQRISDEWGRSGRLDWFSAEAAAVDILIKEGFTGVRVLSDYFLHSPFDICASKNEDMYVFQITTRTHTEKRKQHRLARDLRLNHEVLFMSMKARKYVIKNFSPGGLAELREGEVRKARRF